MADWLTYKRNNAMAYIASDPTVIAFVPRERVSDNAGGFTWTSPTALDPQGFRLITNGNTSIVRTSVDGKSVTPDILIMGPWDALVKEGWEFTVDGRKHEVVYVLPDVKHCVLAEVVRRG
jgi:hypothetical protein